MTGMTINLTLLVQMAHFIFAYMIITRFLLRPGYAAIKADRDQERQIRSRIIARQELIAHKQMYKRSRWELFKDYFSKQKPVLQKEVQSVPTKEIAVPQLSKTEQERLAHEVSVAIKDRVTS